MEPNQNSENPIKDASNNNTQNAADENPSPITSQSSKFTTASSPTDQAQTPPPSGTVIAPASSNSTTATPPPKKSRKKLILLLLVALAILLGAAAYIFGLYLPNRPANVYQTGLERSGDTLDKLIAAATENDQLERLNNAEIATTADFKSPLFNFDGNLDVTLDANSTDGQLTINLKDVSQTERKLNLKFLSDLADNQTIPDFYFQLSGISALGLDQFIPDLKTYEGKWIVVPAKYIQSLTPEQTKPAESIDNVSAEEIAALVRTVSTTTNEYLLTADPDKAILENREFIGREDSEGTDAYRYKVGLNIPHVIDFCMAMTQRVTAEPAYQKLLGLKASDLDAQKEDAEKDCQKLAENDYLKSDPTFDLWIDEKYKLIHKIRAYNTDDTSEYYDIGQTYKGGDMLQLFAKYHNETTKQDGSLTLDVNLDTYVSTGTLKYTDASDADITFTMQTEAKPFDGDVNPDTPANAIPIQEVIQKFFGTPNQAPPSTPGTPQPAQTSVRNRARDTEREIDIKTIHSQLEIAFTDNGYYPSLAQLNDPAWRAANVPSLEEKALQDPESDTLKLTDTAILNSSYGYQPTGCDNNGTQCDKYSLTARLSTNTAYSKSSLN